MIVLTTHDTDGDVLRAIEAGATGYLLKDALKDELFRAVHAVARGEAALALSIATRLVDQMRTPTSDIVSPRELEVLSLVASGANNREAAVGACAAGSALRRVLAADLGPRADAAMNGTRSLCRFNRCGVSPRR